jgi:hypothetical protein
MTVNSTPVSKSIVNVSVQIAGSPFPETTPIYSIWIESRVNQADEAKIVIQLSPSAWEFDTDVLSRCRLGAPVIIELGYGSYKEPVFKGIITQQQLQVSSLADPAITIHCKDTAIIPANIDGNRESVLTVQFGMSILELNTTLDEDFKVYGDVKFQGSSIARVNKYISLTGLGDRFNDDHFIKGVTHLVTQDNWETTTTIGLP